VTEEMFALDETLLRPEAKDANASKDIVAGMGVSNGIDASRQALQQTAQALSRLPGFEQYKPNNPASISQGLMTCLYELQQELLEYSGFDYISLAPLSVSQAMFASLAMIKKHHQVNKNSNVTLFCIEGVSAQWLEYAENMGFVVIKMTAAELAGKSTEQVAAIICPLYELAKGGISKKKFDELKKHGGLIMGDGFEQYFLPPGIYSADFDIDLLMLDLGHLFDIDSGAGAILVNDNLQACLPIPRLKQVEKQLVWQGFVEQPYSIGSLSMTNGNIEFLLQCFIKFKLQGSNGLQREALNADVNAHDLYENIKSKGLTLEPYKKDCSGNILLRLHNSPSAEKDLQLLLTDDLLRWIRVDVRQLAEPNCLQLSLGQLYGLDQSILNKLSNRIVESVSNHLLTEE
jgi:glycine dehydrogenase subunit 2